MIMEFTLVSKKDLLSKAEMALKDKARREGYTVYGDVQREVTEDDNFRFTMSASK